ncbi:hypothetical protein [Arenibaculum pallidiluteum]|uniref:hypothetical protein n=1 Tax=Arenibaculum pallidiluteum TaxID=2812559 RepID=UPI001A97C116|nr:hypothetical protein [Arenibaculum pallidiluteum]
MKIDIVHGLRLERRVGACPGGGEGLMHFRGPPAQHAGQVDQSGFGQGLVAPRLGEAGRQATEHVVPAITPVGDKGLQDAKRRWRMSRPNPFHRSEERRRVSEPSHLRQKVQGLELGLTAGMELPDRLQHGHVANPQGSAWPAGPAANDRPASQPVRPSRGSRRAAEHQARSGHDLPALGRNQPLDQRRDELIVIEGVDQPSLPAVEVDLGDAAMGARHAVPDESEWQEKALLGPVGLSCGCEYEQHVLTECIEPDQIQDAHLGSSRILDAGPLARRNELGQDPFLKGSEEIALASRDRDPIQLTPVDQPDSR